MAGTEQGTILKRCGWRRQLHVHPRNGNGHLGRFNQQLQISQVQCLSGLESGLLNALAVKERSIRAAFVPNNDPVAAQNNFAVMGGNRRVIQTEVVGGPAANAIDTQIEFNHFVAQFARCHH
jgi:hypothetical protein